MGLIKAAISSVTSSLSDTWKDYFVCESLPAGVLMVKGVKKGAGLFDKGDVITNGSGIVVADGQCAIVVDDGVVVEVANEPGNYTFDTSKSPSIFDGGLQGLKDTFAEIAERFTYGGVTNKSQYVYYINTKEITGNMFGTTSPIPFKVRDPKMNLELDVSLKCNGEYSFAVTNPILFYKNVAGNISTNYTKDALANQMRTEMLTALQPAVANLSNLGVNSYSDIPFHTMELVDTLNESLSNKWSDLRGISIVSLGINSITPSQADLERLQNMQEAYTMKDQQMAAGAMAAAQAQAMRDAANNANGAVAGFAGVNMAAGATNVAAMYQNNQSGDNSGGYCPECGKPVPAGAKFCPSCGKALQ
ncbi:MAG: SPFH domain-containing protein [Erysipelotrichaceae bacterium]|nr:SPFH domain-containing protein [Erysipelotrichaceae bacterium]